ncbi:hypothetical protein FVEN_g11592 [Fusarium venenatum]|nr:hypothetical protein FVEN_g11592 [Fusarium venenatum]
MGAPKVFFNDTICGKLSDLLANPHDLGSSDKHWNMIALNIQLLNYWSFACCGLKCLGLRPKATQDPDAPDSTEDSPKVSGEAEWEVVIQFHWLNRRWAKPNVEMDLTGDESMQKMAETQIKYEKARRPPPIPQKGDGVFAAMVLDLERYLASIAAMSGAASYPRLLPPADTSDEIGQEDNDVTDSD